MDRRFAKSTTRGRGKPQPPQHRHAPSLPRPPTKAHLERIRASVAKSYKSLPNVLQIAIGTKFVARSPTNYHHAIQFFVRKKLPRSKVRRRRQIPTFVYGRRSTGEVNRSVRIPTDVIEIGRVLPACAAGDVVRVTGQRGVMTLLFRNKSEPNSIFYAITCSHVVNGMSNSPPVTRNVTADCDPTLPVFASVVKNATAINSQLLYDIAIARLDGGALPQPDLSITSGGVITSLFPPTQITPSIQLSCEFPVSHVLSGTVASSRMSLDIDFPGRTITFENLFAFHSQARQGDSGGLLHRDGSAVGIFVAVSEASPGIGFFQPLQEAFEHLEKLSPQFAMSLF
jgi:hypothetical protein